MDYFEEQMLVNIEELNKNMVLLTESLNGLGEDRFSQQYATRADSFLKRVSIISNVIDELLKKYGSKAIASDLKNEIEKLKKELTVLETTKKELENEQNLLQNKTDKLEDKIKNLELYEHRYRGKNGIKRGTVLLPIRIPLQCKNTLSNALESEGLTYSELIEKYLAKFNASSDKQIVNHYNVDKVKIYRYVTISVYDDFERTRLKYSISRPALLESLISLMPY